MWAKREAETEYQMHNRIWQRLVKAYEDFKAIRIFLYHFPIINIYTVLLRINALPRENVLLQINALPRENASLE